MIRFFIYCLCHRMKILLAIHLLALSFHASSQSNRKIIPLNSHAELSGVNVTFQPTKYEDKRSIRVTDTAQGVTSEVKFVKVKDVEFTNGTIEVMLSGRPLAEAFEGARGFVGIAFRINEENTKFECIYLRPANGRSEDQIRRNHSVQYISYPDFPWQKLRKETPEKYESYVDLEVGKWTKIKIEVQDSIAKLFVHGMTQPSLIVSDLKNGITKGKIGLWIGSGTEAYFHKLIVTTED
jgi:hypothetical protein